MYTAQDLADYFGFTSTQTIYKLVHAGVLPPATGRGRGAHYGKVHFDRLKAYRDAIPRRGDRVTRACLAQRFNSGAPPP